MVVMTVIRTIIVGSGDSGGENMNELDALIVFMMIDCLYK